MAPIVLIDAKIFFQGRDLSGRSNAVALGQGVDLVDGTVFGASTKRNLPGLKVVAAHVSGLWDEAGFGDDRILFNNVGRGGAVIPDGVLYWGNPLTVAPASPEGTAAYLFNAEVADYKLGGPIGGVLSGEADFEALASPLVRGVLAASRAIVGSGTGSVYQLGAVAAGQRVYASLHIPLIDPAASLTVIIQSDDNVGMSSPTTRASFAAAGGGGPDNGQWSQWISAAGPITDTYWRVNYTLTGASATFAVGLGIL